MKKDGMNRRGFLKKLGAGMAATTALYGCSSETRQKAATVSAESETPGEMTYRTSLTGDKVSLLGYGCMRWPMKKNKDGKDVVDQETVNELVDYAIAHGVNYFDTSPVYLQGQSESATGIALKRHPRDKFFIATKMSNFGIYTLEGAKKMYEQSFKELQVDYIDYYLLHSVGGSMDDFNKRYIENGVLDFLLKEREARHIRNLGWSFHGRKEVFDEILNMDVKWDFVQIQLNYSDWKHASGRNVNAEYLYQELEKKGIPVVIMEPLLGGRLSKLSDHLVGRFKQRRPNQSVASWAFRFSGHWPGILCSLSGMTYKEHLIDNLKTFSPLEPLTDEELAFLEDTAQLMLQYPTIHCNDCKYCMPCPYGIDIPAILLHYNKCVNEGYVPKDSQDPKYREARRAFLVGYDRSVPKLRQANHCIGCNKCIHDKHCPQRINIPRQLQRIDEFVEKLKQETL
ncbi:MAG: aldo/keto reductase [Bacteroides sp.]|nr:aldo/keto reductase [Bacteroides sp.]